MLGAKWLPSACALLALCAHDCHARPSSAVKATPKFSEKGMEHGCDVSRVMVNTVRVRVCVCGVCVDATSSLFSLTLQEVAMCNPTTHVRSSE
jgi:hypothetical protein